jgi:hypothetical protein
LFAGLGNIAKPSSMLWSYAPTNPSTAATAAAHFVPCTSSAQPAPSGVCAMLNERSSTIISAGAAHSPGPLSPPSSASPRSQIGSSPSAAPPSVSDFPPSSSSSLDSPTSTLPLSSSDWLPLPIPPKLS